MNSFKLSLLSFVSISSFISIHSGQAAIPYASGFRFKPSICCIHANLNSIRMEKGVTSYRSQPLKAQLRDFDHSVNQAQIDPYGRWTIEFSDGEKNLEFFAFDVIDEEFIEENGRTLFYTNTLTRSKKMGHQIDYIYFSSSEEGEFIHILENGKITTISIDAQFSLEVDNYLTGEAENTGSTVEIRKLN